jgi:hypothetical protein
MYFSRLSSPVLISPASSQAQAAKAKAVSAPAVDAAKAALSKYSDPFVAIRDGYFSTVACMDFPTGAKDGPIEYPPGAMGVQAVHDRRRCGSSPALGRDA